MHGREPPVLVERTLHVEKVLHLERRREERTIGSRVVDDSNLLRFLRGERIFLFCRRRAPQRPPPPTRRRDENGRDQRRKSAATERFRFRGRRPTFGRTQARDDAKLVRGRAVSRANEFDGGDDRRDDVETGGSVVAE